jgi:hypothetical protein
MISALLFFLVVVLSFYVCHLDNRITRLQLDLIRYSTHDYVMQRFSNVWKEIHHTQDEVDKLKSKRGNR